MNLLSPLFFYKMQDFDLLMQFLVVLILYVVISIKIHKKYKMQFLATRMENFIIYILKQYKFVFKKSFDCRNGV